MDTEASERPETLRFEFQNWTVYERAIEFGKQAFILCSAMKKSDAKELRDQLRRASQSIALNLAEGSARYTKPDKINFFRISRGSVFECVAILDLIQGLQLATDAELVEMRANLGNLGKMLSGLIRFIECNEPRKRNP